MYQNVDLPGARTQLISFAHPDNYLKFYALGDSIAWIALVGNNLGTSFNIIASITYTTD